ncbi:MAG: potassium channel family protein [Phycisphaerales bacterium]|nr:two pore domain potassium channel family protein [Planctomycetota bacterium]
MNQQAPGKKRVRPVAGAAKRLIVVSERIQPGLRKHSVATFLIAMILFMVLAPALESLAWGDFIMSTLLSAMMLTGVLAVGASRRKLILGVMLVIPALVLRWLNHTQPNPMPPFLFLIGALTFLLFVMVNLLAFILRSPVVSSEVLCGGVVVYLILGLLWALAYTTVAELDPGAFTFTAGNNPNPLMKGVTAYYYSFITLNTVGYGDIVPASRTARMLAVMESTVGVFYMALMVARLVSLYTSHNEQNEQNGIKPG